MIHELKARGCTIIAVTEDPRLASTLAGLACFKLSNWLGSVLGWQTTLQALLVLVIVTSVGLVLLALFARLMGLREFEDLLKRVLT